MTCGRAPLSKIVSKISPNYTVGPIKDIKTNLAFCIFPRPSLLQYSNPTMTRVNPLPTASQKCRMGENYLSKLLKYDSYAILSFLLLFFALWAGIQGLGVPPRPDQRDITTIRPCSLSGGEVCTMNPALVKVTCPLLWIRYILANS